MRFEVPLEMRRRGSRRCKSGKASSAGSHARASVSLRLKAASGFSMLQAPHRVMHKYDRHMTVCQDKITTFLAFPCESSHKPLICKHLRPIGFVSQFAFPGLARPQTTKIRNLQERRGRQERRHVLHRSSPVLSGAEGFIIHRSARLGSFRNGGPLMTLMGADTERICHRKGRAARTGSTRRAPMTTNSNARLHALCTTNP